MGVMYVVHMVLMVCFEDVFYILFCRNDRLDLDAACQCGAGIHRSPLFDLGPSLYFFLFLSIHPLQLIRLLCFSAHFFTLPLFHFLSLASPASL